MLVQKVLILSLATIFAAATTQAEVQITHSLDEYNRQLAYFSHIGALLAWNISMEMTPEVLNENEKFSIKRNIWNNQWCSALLNFYDIQTENGKMKLKPWSMEEFRQVYLICRGPRFTSYQLSNILSILSTMQELYNKEVCVEGKCLRMEPDLNRFMETNRDESQLRKAWIAWHEKIGPDVKPLYISLIRMLNQGARQAGHSDMGQCWREETEIADLRNVALKLYSDVKYLYALLHSYVRFKIGKFYDIQLNNGPIPAHLLGNMWAQKWDSLIDIIWPGMESEPNHLVKSLLPLNASVVDMVRAAETFFMSMGLPRLPETFWQRSYFQDQEEANSKMSSKFKTNQRRNCHGSAANMFGSPEPDFRIMMCAEVNDSDLITIHHEVGHIMYFMAYKELPTIFQDGANSAFHESVGDSITYGLKAETKVSIKSLLKVALAKLPQIGFGLVMDMWRWSLFENEEVVQEWNDGWWRLNYEFLGIAKPAGYGQESKRPTSEGLDAAGKFHIIDNIPYIRYFMASFLQIQFYEAMCKAAGWEDLHQCQIRGSKAAGNVLWKMMSQGSRKHWAIALEEMTGSKEIMSGPLLKYFQPLQIWLENQIQKNNLTLGW